MARHRRCDVCLLSNRAGYECEDRQSYFPAPASSCSRSAARGRFRGTMCECQSSFRRNVERPTPNVQHPNRYRNLLDDLEGGPLTVTRCGTIQHRANGMNRLPVPTDDAADIALTQLHFANCHLSARNFVQPHLLWKFDQLPTDEFEKLFPYAI